MGYRCFPWEQPALDLCVDFVIIFSSSNVPIYSHFLGGGSHRCKVAIAILQADSLYGQMIYRLADESRIMMSTMGNVNFACSDDTYRTVPYSLYLTESEQQSCFRI